jgi:hypothetical protein
MKKTIVAVFMIYLVGATAFGQNEKPFVKGTVLTGGSLSVNFEREKDFLKGSIPNLDVNYLTKLKSIETDFQIGYFILNHISIGIKSKVSFINYITTNDLTSAIVWDIKDRDFISGPFFRYYLNQGIFLEGFGGIGFQNENSKNGKFKQNLIAYSAGVGYSLLLNKYVTLEPILSYNLLDKKASDHSEKVTISKYTFSLGIQFYLSKKKS